MPHGDGGTGFFHAYGGETAGQDPLVWSQGAFRSSPAGESWSRCVCRRGATLRKASDVFCLHAAPASICKIHPAAPAPRLGAHGAITSRGTQLRNFRAPGGGAEESSLQRCVPVGTRRPQEAHPSAGAAAGMEILRALQRSGGPGTEQTCVRLCDARRLRKADFLQ